VVKVNFSRKQVLPPKFFFRW